MIYKLNYTADRVPENKLLNELSFLYSTYKYIKCYILYGERIQYYTILLYIGAYYIIKYNIQ